MKLMQKIIASCVTGVLFVSIATADITVDWSATALPPTTWLYNSAVSDYPLANTPDPVNFPNGTYSSWAVELVAYSGVMDWNTLFSQYELGNYALGGSETSLDAASFEGDFAVGAENLGFFESTSSVSAGLTGQKLYMRFFNADTVGNATEAGFVYDDAWVLPADEQAAAIDMLEPAGNKFGTLANSSGIGAYAGGSWYTVAVVPEPGTMALLGLGMVVLAYRRRR
jgi:hypothetical protein